MLSFEFSFSDDDKIEFGTVLIYTCSRSCWSDDESAAPQQEYPVYYPDPDLKYFKSHTR